MRRGVQVPCHGVAAAPVSKGLGADLQRHPYAVAGIEPGATHLGQLPARAQVAGAHLGVSLESAAGQHHRPATHLPEPVGVAHRKPNNVAAPVGDQPGGFGLVEHLCALPLHQLEQPVGQALAGAHGLHDQPAPEPHHAVLLERLPAVGQDPARPLLGHPAHGWIRLVHQGLH